MRAFKENDCISLTKEISGEIIGEQQSVILPIGTTATIVLVHGNPNQPMAYEIEAYISAQDCYVLATLEAADAS